MAQQDIEYVARSQASNEGNLTSLGNNAAKPLGAVDNTTEEAENYHYALKMKLGASGVSAEGTVEVYLLERDHSSGDWSDGIDPSGTSDIAANIKNARLLFVLDGNANGQSVVFHFRLRDWISDVPPYHSLVVLNKTGAAFTSTGSDHDCQYTPIHFTI